MIYITYLKNANAKMDSDFGIGVKCVIFFLYFFFIVIKKIKNLKNIFYPKNIFL